MLVKRKNTLINTVIIVLCVAILGTVLVACGGGGEEVSITYYTYADTYMSSVRTSMDKYLKEEGLNFHNYDANSNQTTQTEQVDTAITKGASIIAVNVVDTGSDDAATTIVNKAKAANIPLIFFNRSVSEEVVRGWEKCVFVGTDYEMAGRMQGQMIGEYLKENFDRVDLNGDGKISYVMFKGQQGNLEAEARTRYAVEVCNEILAEEGKAPLSFYDKNNPNGYIVDQDGNWSNAAANNSMKTILSGYSESGGNMVELVIANNDEMALGALAALEEAGYNKGNGKVIPVFGIDASEAARNKIRSGAMAGTIKQDADGMARAIAKIAANFKAGKDPFDGIDENNIVDGWRVNIPYSVYTGEEA